MNEDNLLNFIQMLAGNSRNPSLSWSLRIQGEIHYAQGNYLAAMQNFITALIVSTQFFLKPWSNMQGLYLSSECSIYFDSLLPTLHWWTLLLF